MLDFYVHVCVCINKTKDGLTIHLHIISPFTQFNNLKYSHGISAAGKLFGQEKDVWRSHTWSPDSQIPIREDAVCECICQVLRPFYHCHTGF